jgi:hypothetical protein
MWYLIKRIIKDPCSPSILRVQCVVDGETHEYASQDKVKNAIQRKWETRFSLAHSVPIMNTLLGEQLQYLSDETIARAIMLGTYDISTDLDLATRLILEEIGKLGVKLVNKEDFKIIIMVDKFQTFWRRVGEFTSSSMSGIHYGHYKAAIQCKASTNILAQQLTVIARSGIPPKSWGVGLQVMLEKIVGICLMEKLRAIQLYEADFKFGCNTMNKLDSSGYIPEELFSHKGSTAEDTKFDKTLTADLLWQA